MVYGFKLPPSFISDFSCSLSPLYIFPVRLLLHSICRGGVVVYFCLGIWDQALFLCPCHPMVYHTAVAPFLVPCNALSGEEGSHHNTSPAPTLVITSRSVNTRKKSKISSWGGTFSLRWCSKLIFYYSFIYSSNMYWGYNKWFDLL